MRHLMVCIAAALLLTGSAAFAGTKYWVGPEDGLASTAINWEPAGAPSDGDDIIFSSSSTGKCYFDISADSVFGSMTLDATFVCDSTSTGIVEFVPSNDAVMTILNDLTVTNGTFYMTASTVTVYGNVTSVSSGSINAVPSSTLYLSSGMAGATLSLTAQSRLPNLWIEKTGAISIELGSDVTVLGSYINIGDNPLGMNGRMLRVSCDVNTAVTGDISDGIVVMSAPAAYEGNKNVAVSNGGTIANFVVNCPDPVYCDADINVSTFTLVAGSVTATNLNVYTYFNAPGGELVSAVGTVNLLGTRGTIASAIALPDLRVNASTWTVSGSLACDSIALSTGAILVTGGDVTLTSTGGIAVGGAEPAAGEAFNVTGSTIVCGGELSVAYGSSLLLNSGTLTFATSSMTVYGSLTTSGAGNVIKSTATGSTCGVYLMDGSTSTVSGLTFSGLGFDGVSVDQSAIIAGIGSLAFTNTAPGTVALNVQSTDAQFVIDQISFDAGVGVNISAPNLVWPNYIALTNHSGPKTGVANEDDPNHVLFWKTPDAVDVSLATSSVHSILWTWTPSDDEVLYRVYSTTASESLSGDLAASLDTAATTQWQLQGLAPNTTYSAFVTAYNMLGVSTSAVQSAMTLAAVPSDAAEVVRSSFSLTICWSPSDNPLQTRYQIKYATEPAAAAGFTVSALQSGTTQTITDLLPATTYYLAVRAVNDVGEPSAYMGGELSLATFSAPPAVPAGLAGTAISSSSILWSWSCAAGATYYVLSDTMAAVVNTLEGFTGLEAGTTSWLETGLPAPDAAVMRLLAAGNEGGLGGQSGPATAYPYGVAPTSIVAAVTSSTQTAGFDLSWAGHVSGSCRVEVSTNAANWVILTTTTASSYTGSGLTFDTTYYCRIGAVNQAGEVNPTYGMLISSVTRPLTAALEGVVHSTGSISWSWPAQHTAWVTVYSTAGAPLSPAIQPGTTFWIEGQSLQTNHAYGRYIVVQNASAAADPSDAVLRQTLADIPGPALDITVSSCSATIGWQVNSNPDGTLYQVQRSTMGNFSPVTISSTVTPPLVTGPVLQPYTTYYFRVRALNGDGVFTDFSSFSEVRTLHAPPGAPTGLSGSAVSTTTIAWTWDLASGATAYIVYTSTGGFRALLPGFSPLEAGTTSWTESGFEPNTQVIRRVSAFNAAGESAGSDPDTCYTWALPPVSIAVDSTTEHTVTISHVTSTAAFNTLQWSTDAASWVTVSTTTPDDLCAVSGLQADTTHYFRYGALNVDGIQNADAFTDVVAAVTFPSSAALTGIAVSTASITWSWSDAAEGPASTGYNIYTATAGFLLNLPAGTTQWTEASLVPDQPVTRILRACNSAGESAEATFVRSAWAVPPAAMTISSVTASSLVASWSASAATQYRLDVSTNGSVWVAASTSSVLSRQLGSLSADTTYYLRIGVINGDAVTTPALFSPIYAVATLPAGPSVTSVAVSTGSIAWNLTVASSSTLAGYNIYSSTGLIHALGAAATTWLEQGLASNISYTRYFASFNGSGESGQTTAARCTLAAAPPAVIISSVTDTVILAQWADSGASQYRVERATGAFDGSTVISTQAATMMLATALQPDTTYHFRVTALNAEGVSSPSSVQVSTMTLPASPVFSAITLSTGSIRWQWGETGANLTGYRIYASSDSSLLTTILAGTSYWIESNLAPSTAYGRTLASFNGSGESAASQLTRCTWALAPTAPVISTATMHAILLTWNGAGAAAYRVDRSTDSSSWTTLGTAANAAYLDSGLSYATTYYYAVRGYNQDGIVTASSATVSAMTAALVETAALVVTTNTAPVTVTETTPSGTQTILTIPAGTFSTDAYILVNTNPLTAPSEYSVEDLDGATAALTAGRGRLLAGSAIEIHAYDLSGTTLTAAGFLQPVTIVMSYTDADDDGFVDGITPPLRAQSLRVFTYDAALQRWTQVPGQHTVDTAAKTVTVTVSHFSVYALASPSSVELSLASVVVYPNPYKPGTGGIYDNTSSGEGVLFDKLTAEARIRVYNIAGELVADLRETDGDGRLLWNTRNDAGDAAASGVYVYIVTNPDDSAQKAKGKFAIIR